jgi:hypothetical protein
MAGDEKNRSSLDSLTYSSDFNAHDQSKVYIYALSLQAKIHGVLYVASVYPLLILLTPDYMICFYP